MSETRTERWTATSGRGLSGSAVETRPEVAFHLDPTASSRPIAAPNAPDLALPPVAAPVDPAVEAVPPAVPFSLATLARTSPAQLVLIVLGAVAFCYFARPVLLPVILALVAGAALKPIIRWSSARHIQPALSAAVVLCFIVAAAGIGFYHLGGPASRWINEAPHRMTELRQRVQVFFPPISGFSEAAAAVNNLGATEEEKREEQAKAPTVAVQGARGTDSILDWTGSLLVGVGETLVLIYLLLAYGDVFMQKLVHVMPTWRDKKRAVEITREVQQSVSNYLFSVSLINIGLGIIVSAGLYFMGVPNAALWGVLAAVLNFVPYFGPVVGVTLLAAVGLLTFDQMSLGLLPALWYFVLHLLETNFITPVLLGRRFTLNPLVIFVSLIFWTWLWGVPGALLSVPILVSIKAVCDGFPALAPVSELLTS